MISFEGHVLPPPVLRFDRTIPSHRSRVAYQGIRSFGPYAQPARGLPSKGLMFVFPETHRDLTREFAVELINGVGSFAGFGKTFRLPVTADTISYLSVPLSGGLVGGAASRAYREAIDNWAGGPGRVDPEVAVVLVPHTERWDTDQPYYNAKARFAVLGVPTQMVTTELLHDPARRAWAVANVALGVFAKLGGTPWVVEAPSEEADVVVGVGRADIRRGAERARIFGYAVSFISNGLYQQTWSFTPVAGEEEYEQRLGDAVRAAVADAMNLDRPVRRLVFHLGSRTGRREVEAVRAARDAVDATIPAAFLRLDDSTSYDLMDLGEATYGPRPGLVVRLAARRALLQLEGVSAAGAPHGPLLIEMDRRGEVGPEHLDELSAQVHRLGAVNWRGFNARSRPVTLLYGEQLARLVGYLEDVGGWDATALRSELRKRPWFL